MYTNYNVYFLLYIKSCEWLALLDVQNAYYIRARCAHRVLVAAINIHVEVICSFRAAVDISLQ